MVTKLLGFALVTGVWCFIISVFDGSVLNLSTLEVFLGGVVMTFVTEKAAVLHDNKYAKKHS